MGVGGRELTGRRADGSRFPMELSISRTEGNGAGLIVGIMRDITERKEFEDALRKSRDTLERRVRERTEELEKANEAKSKFLAVMSHELRTPLNAILGFAEMIEGQALGPVGNPAYVQYGADIQTSGHHLLRLINDLLDLSKIEAGRLELTFEPLDVAEAVTEAVRTIGALAADKNIAVGVELAPALPPLDADQRALDQMLLNLLSNSVKFTPGGGQVTVRAEDADGRLRLSVADTGIGIRPEDVDKVLTPFGQVTDPMTEGVKGTGLGLAIVKSLVELHGGSLNVDSTPGRGTTMTLEFPRRRGDGDASG